MRFTINAALTLVISISPLLSLTTPAFPEDEKSGYATVFIYHKFNEPESPSTSIPTEQFEAQLRYLKENRYNVIGLPELVSLIRNGSDIPPKTVVITIDDAYRSVYKHAFPLLKRYGLPFTVFLYMEAVGRYSDYITLEELNTMGKYRKVTFGNHSYSHARLARWPEGMPKEEYLKWLEDDLIKSGEAFEKLLGYRPRFYAYPYGEYNHEYSSLVKRHGYLAAFTQDTGSAGGATDPFLITRNPVVGTWATMEKFKEFLETEPLQAEVIYPPYGILYENPPGRVEAGMADMDRYKNIGIYVSELGWLQPKIDRNGKRISVKDIKRLTRETNRIGITAKNIETGKIATFFYMVILRSPSSSILPQPQPSPHPHPHP